MNEAEADRPFVSVVIPCRNAARWIDAVLDGLARQTYPPGRIEVIVVDNGSSDGSREVVRKRGVTLLEEPVRSAYAARNRGIRAARGEFLLFLDADTVPCSEWAAAMVGCAQRTGSHLVGGRIENAVMRRNLGSALLAHLHSAAVRRRHVVEHGALSAGNMLVAAEAFRRFGVFSSLRSGGDRELAGRMNPGHRPVPYADDACVTHQCDVSNLGFLLRAFRIRYGQEAQPAPVASGARRLLRLCAAFPWRPGLRRAAALRRELAPACRVAVPALAAYLWLERLAAYAGALCGWLRGRRRRQQLTGRQVAG